MKVIPEKRMELSQTITSLSSFIRMEKGCRCCDFYRSIEDENRLFLLEEWDTQKDLLTHLKSEHFRVLGGAINLLQEPLKGCSTSLSTRPGWRRLPRAGLPYITLRW
jgi:quinol monooxygenase YgiN